jgi:hypothetical protein
MTEEKAWRIIVLLSSVAVVVLVLRIIIAAIEG